MYNLYTYQKNLLLKEKNKYEEEKSRRIRLKRKFQIRKLSSNYDKRMNDFILNLCYRPIYIKNETTNKNHPNFRLSTKTPQSRYRNFSFGGFMTDKNRISLIKKEKELNKKYEEKILQEKSRSLNLENNNKKKPQFIQPIMRFKHRNELERILEAMDLLGKGKTETKMKKVVNQLKQTDIDKLRHAQGFWKLKQIYKHKTIDNNRNKKKKNDSKSDDSISNSVDEDNKDQDLDYNLEFNIHRKLININRQLKKQKKLRDQRLIDNTTGKTLEENQLLSKLESRNKGLIELFKDDEKMHFKGASQYVMSIQKQKEIRTNSALPFYNTVNDIKKNNINKINKLSNIKKIKFKIKKENQRPMTVNNLDLDLNKERLIKYFKDDSIKKLGIKYQIQKRKMDEVIKKEIDNSILTGFYEKLNKKEYSQYFSEPFFLEKNKILLNKQIDIIDSDLDEKLNYLRKIIDLNKNTYIIKPMKAKTRIYNKKNIKKEKDDNEIVIEGIKYKNDDIKNIADAIFTKCGYYNKKIV